MPERAIYGLLAEFDSPVSLTLAARRVREEGYRELDAFTPFPVEELKATLGLRERCIGPIFFLGGVGGLALSLLVMWYVNYDFPLNVGGRPLLAWPAFLVVGFELMILGSVCSGVLGMLILNGLPLLHHPLFEASRFRFASDDRFFLCILASDPQFDDAVTGPFLQGLGARSIEIVKT